MAGASASVRTRTRQAVENLLVTLEEASHAFGEVLVLANPFDLSGESIKHQGIQPDTSLPGHGPRCLPRSSDIPTGDLAHKP
jgi:hypothetical protein